MTLFETSHFFLGYLALASHDTRSGRASGNTKDWLWLYDMTYGQILVTLDDEVGETLVILEDDTHAYIAYYTP
jgi:hypothetical protein